MTDKKELKPFDEVKDKIRKDIEQQRLQDTTGKWKQQVVNDLLKDADIKVNNKEFLLLGIILKLNIMIQ